MENMKDAYVYLVIKTEWFEGDNTVNTDVYGNLEDALNQVDEFSKQAIEEFANCYEDASDYEYDEYTAEDREDYIKKFNNNDIVAISWYILEREAYFTNSSTIEVQKKKIL